MRWVVVLALVAACKVPTLVYQCGADAQCSGSGGRCVDGACAFPSASCESGYAWDRSAGARAGQCVAPDAMTSGGDDMALDGDGDLAMPGSTAAADMAAPPDLAVAHCSWHASNNLPETATRIWATDASHLWAAGDDLMSSNTSGVGWSTRLLRDSNNLAVHVHALIGFGATIFAACSGMNVFMVDGSGTLTLDHPGTLNADLFGMWGASSSDLFATGDVSALLHRKGTTWAQESSVTMGADMMWMHGSSATNIWAAGDNMVSRFDGQKWTPQTLSVGSNGITSVFVLDDKNVYLTQGSGSYYATHDGGATWGGGPTGLTSGASIFGFPGHLYVVGSGDSVAHSIDDGAHWKLEDTGTKDTQLSQVWGRSPTELYVVGGQWWAVCD